MRGSGSWKTGAPMVKEINKHRLEIPKCVFCGESKKFLRYCLGCGYLTCNSCARIENCR